jgi:tetratricopeptide (TPR) repeat protein
VGGGFARVMVETDKFNEAIKHFETAKKLCDDQYQRVALLSDTGVAYSFARNFEFANEQFRQSTALDPKYPNAWLRWSQSLFREGNYEESWAKHKQARALGAAIPDSFTRALTEKMPEPR